MKNSFFLTILLLHLFSCAPEKTKTIETEEIDHSERDDQKPYVNPNAIDSISEFSLFQVKRTFTLTSGEKIDFRNFTYEDCILRNGVSYIDSDFGFDTTRLIKDHQITDSLFLIELYEYFGGGSSELIKIIYLLS